MMGYPIGVSEQNTGVERNSGILEAFLNPGTFPHVVLLVAISGILYSIMKMGILEMDQIGSAVFLSLSISYIISALFIQTRLGNKILMVNDDGQGIFNINYWKKSSKALIIVGLFSFLITAILVNQIPSASIVLFMGFLFIFMSFGQALSIVSGGVNYYNSKSELKIESKTGMLATFFRVILVLLIFGPLIWLIEIGSVDSSVGLSFGIKFLVLIFLSGVVIFLDKITESIRINNIFDGKILDRFLAIMIITTCWHILSALRRTPIFLDPSESAVILEEGLLMSISIILTVWSISNRGAKRGWKIFQSQSAIFWGISFGYAYAGSVASVSSLSEGRLDLISITAIGHIVTSFSIIIMIPFAIKSFKKIVNIDENNMDNEQNSDVEIAEETEDSGVIKKQNISVKNDEFSEDENFDGVELIN